MHICGLQVMATNWVGCGPPGQIASSAYEHEVSQYFSGMLIYRLRNDIYRWRSFFGEVHVFAVAAADKQTVRCVADVDLHRLKPFITSLPVITGNKYLETDRILHTKDCVWVPTFPSNVAGGIGVKRRKRTNCIKGKSYLPFHPLHIVKGTLWQLLEKILWQNALTVARHFIVLLRKFYFIHKIRNNSSYLFVCPSVCHKFV